MGASLPLSSSFTASADISASQKRSSVRLPDALRPLASAIRRSASRVSRGGDLERERGMEIGRKNCREGRYFTLTIDFAMLAPAVAFIDLETTGTTSTVDRITEIGIVRVQDGELVEEWSTLVNPECPIPEEIQVLTGITN